MEVPFDVAESLRSIRSTLRLVYNPTGKLVGGHSFDVNGQPREKLYEPRWELWDTDANGVDYKLTTLEDVEGGYRPPDQRIVELVRLINPERYDGDISKMIEALVDEPNNYIEGLNESRFEELVEHLGDLYWTNKTPQIAVPKTIVSAQLG